MDKDLSNLVKEEENRLKELYGIKKQLKDIEDDINRARVASNKAFNQNNKKEYELQKQRMKESQQEQEKVLRLVNKLAIRNATKEFEIQKENIEKIQKRRIESEAKIADLESKKRKTTSKEKRKEIDNEIKANKEVLSGLDRQVQNNKKLYELDKKRSDAVKKIREESQKEYNLSKSLMKGPSTSNKIEGARLHTSTKTKEYADLLKQKEEERNELGRQGKLDEETLSNYNKEMNKLKLKEFGWGVLSNAIDKIGSEISSVANKALSGVNVAIQDVTSHRTHVMTRLQGAGGSEYDYAGLMDTVSKNLAVSPYITQRAFMKKLDEAVDKGIAYNVEQRTFLATIKDEIATTFDAFDSNLLRLIKLQQADSTAARLGMEAALTKTLNSVFSDSSYLTDNVYSSVRGALVEAESTMGRNMATEFEYVVQKWLGSLYSLGASNELINQIAQGLNYIGTGNVQALANNAPLQTLFAMSASRATGVDYADLLVGGLTTEKTNELLKSMVEYLKEIAEDNKNNNVVKSAYGDLYKMSLADMRAITSLTNSDISSIYSQNMNYSDMGNALSSQFNSISKRLSTSEMIKNVVDNFVYSLGSEITQNAVSYVLWEVTDLIEQSTGGIHLPAISVFGNMVDLSSFTIEGMMKTGLVGLATLGQIGNIFSSIGNKGGLSMDAWNYADTLQRGQIETQTAGSISTTSGSTYVGSSSSSDMKNSSIASATEDAGEVSEITNADNESEYTFDDWYKAILVDQEPIYTKSGEEFSVSDLYRAMYDSRVPVPVEISPLTKLGSALDALATYLLNAHRITDVNIKKSDIFVPVTVQDFESKFKNEIRNYIKSVYIETLSQELKENLIGNTRGASSATIAKVCDKILNDKVDVMVENDGFDLFLANSYALHG